MIRTNYILHTHMPTVMEFGRLAQN